LVVLACRLLVSRLVALGADVALLYPKITLTLCFHDRLTGSAKCSRPHCLRTLLSALNLRSTFCFPQLRLHGLFNEWGHVLSGLAVTKLPAGESTCLVICTQCAKTSRASQSCTKAQLRRGLHLLCCFKCLLLQGLKPGNALTAILLVWVFADVGQSCGF